MLATLNNLLWDRVLIFVLVPLGLWFTIASGAVQFRYFGHMFGIMREAFKHQAGRLSSFQALTLSVAGRVGGGNIAGVAVAISLGGPGAVFWMWVVGLIGMATSFFECSLAQLYKRKDADGIFRGGPAYYIEHGLGQRWLAVLFSILLLVTFGLAFIALQSYMVAASMSDSLGLPRWISGIVLAVALGGIVFGGIKRMASVTEWLVPVMGVGYLLMALVVISLNFTRVPDMLLLIVENAFGYGPALGGGVGAAIILGVKRGLFSNEAGLGSAPNVAAVAWVPHPAAQGVVQAFSVFIDTLVMCTCTAVIILLAGLDGAGMDGVVLTQNALAVHVGDWGRIFVSFALLLFAFSSIMYNYYLGENSINYLGGDSKKQVQVFRVFVLGLVLWGSLQDLGTVFAFADLTMGLLALVNLVAITLLWPVGRRLLRDYDARRRGPDGEPVLDPADFSDLDIDQQAWPARGE
ncbi:MAG: alanine:cation symporter family protein [Gammaproteobacteria bacterium]|jgi:AGCS family alanine or glycine:cation symporter|nr:alanine:cation symporter family protein [Gammaproteobacteria bacterium]